MEVLQGELSAALVAGASLDQGTVGEGRVAELFSEVELLVSVAEEVVVAGELDGGRVRGEGLDDDFALELTTASPAGDLGQQLEGALTGAEIGNMQAEVGIQYADQSDVGEMQALGNHLGANDDIDLALAELSQGVAQGVLAAHGVRIDAGDACLRENFFDHTSPLAPCRSPGCGWKGHRRRGIFWE